MVEQTELGVEIEAPTREATDVAVLEERRQVVAAHDINSLMALAIENEGAIEVIERLAELREKEMAREAEQQFMAAFAEFKRRCPPIPRNKKGAEFAGRGGTKSHVMYAPLETIQGIVDPILNSVGLSYWWTSEATAETVVTTCHLRHVAGHERASTMALPVSGPPKSSKTQAHAGTRTFNNRLTLSDVLGIQTVDDVDGADAGSGEVLTLAQIAEIQSLVKRAGSSLAAVLRVGGADNVEQITQDKYDLIVDTLRVKILRREAEGDA